MSVSHLTALMEPSRGARWLKQWWPSRRLRTDPLQDLLIDGRYAPVSIANWKLIPPAARELLAKRVARALSFTSDCRLTIVIPFRDRQRHLEQLLPVLTAKLAEQKVSHRILVVEQEAEGLFNRGRLLNIGALHAADSTDYYCLHDVDAVPVNANYLCPSQPLRLVNQINGEQGKSQRTDYYFSGAVSLRKEQLFAANGFSNEYWGWGKEDDDFFFRLLMAGFLCYFDQRGIFEDLPNPAHQRVSRKSMLVPRHVRLNRRRRSRLLRGLHDPTHDGLTTLRYEVIERFEHAHYEKIRVRW